MTSPAPEELLHRAWSIATKLGGIPSQNRLMRELQIGAPRAKGVREALLTQRQHLRGERRRTMLQAIRRRTPQPRTGRLPQRTWPVPEPTPEPAVTALTPVASPQVTNAVDAPEVHPAPASEAVSEVHPKRPASWPILILAAPAFVAIWSGWVGLGGMTGFGVVHPLPGIADGLSINSAITLPIGMEAYAAYALRVWLSGRHPDRARRFARWSAIGALLLGAAGQIGYHQMQAIGMTVAPWWVTTLVSCLPVAVLGMGAALAHLVRAA